MWNTSLTSTSGPGCHQASQGLALVRRDAQNMQGNINLWVILCCRLNKIFFFQNYSGGGGGKRLLNFVSGCFLSWRELHCSMRATLHNSASGPQDWWLSLSCLCSRTFCYFWKPSNMPSGLQLPRFSFWRCFLQEVCMLFPKELLPSRLPHLHPFQRKRLLCGFPWEDSGGTQLTRPQILGTVLSSLLLTSGKQKEKLIESLYRFWSQVAAEILGRWLIFFPWGPFQKSWKLNWAFYFLLSLFNSLQVANWQTFTQN